MQENTQDSNNKSRKCQRTNGLIV